MPPDQNVEDLEPLCSRNNDSLTEVEVTFLDKTNHILVSPNYPLVYPYDLSCLWLVESDTDTKIRVDFLHVSFLCYTDTISVGNGNDPEKINSLIVTRGGVFKLRGVQSSSNTMWIQMNVFDCYKDLRSSRDYRKWDESYDTIDLDSPSEDFLYLGPYDNSHGEESIMDAASMSENKSSEDGYRGYGIRLEVSQVSKGM